MSENLEQTIALCKDCNDRTGGDSFSFPLRPCNVMIVSACPSYQAAYRPLTSIRFFRQLIYALLGQEGVSEEGLMRFFTIGGLYWTHYHKCYDERFYRIGTDGLYELQNLPTSCAGRYLNEEIRQVAPRLIIVLGKANVNRMFHYTLKHGETFTTEKLGVTCLCADYPANSTTEAYESIRRYVAEALGIQPPAKEIDMTQFFDRAVKSAVSLSFEAQAVQKLNDRLAGCLTTAPERFSLLDNAWLDGVVVPMMLRQVMVLRYWSLMESQIKAFLMNEYSPSRAGHETFGSILMDISKSWTADDVVKKISDKWLMAMKRYINRNVIRSQSSPITSQNAYIKNWEQLHQKLEAIKHVRHIIVHSDGFVSRRDLYQTRNYQQYANAVNKKSTINDELRKAGITSIEVLTNMVYISDNGLEELEALSSKVASFIDTFERALAGSK